MSVEEFLKRADKTILKSNQIKEKEDIEGPFCRYAKRKGCNALKLIILRKKGFPDRTILCPGGRVFFIEFKRPGEKLSGLQELVRKLLVGFGFKYYICDQPGQAEEILDKFLTT